MKLHAITDDYLIQPELQVSLHGVKFPLEYLYRSCLTIGQPGSGKTRCILMPLIRSILATTGINREKKASLIVADPKNEFAPFLTRALAEMGRQDDLVILRPGSAYYNPLSNPFLANDGEMVERIVSLAENSRRESGSVARDHAFWENSQRNLLGAIVAAARILHGSDLTFATVTSVFRQIDKFKTPFEASAWKDWNKLPPAAASAIREYLRLPGDSTRPCVANCVSNCLFLWDREPLANLVSPVKELPTINPFDIIDQGKILLIGCSSAAYGVSLTPLILALKEHFFTALLSRDQIDVKNGTGWRPINQTRPVFFVADEFQSYVSPNAATGELTALDRLRGFKAGYLAATQNVASLHSVLGNEAHADRLISLFANQIFLSNICPVTARQAQFILGDKWIKERHSTRRRVMAPPLLVNREGWRQRSHEDRDVTIVPRQVPRVTGAVLAALKTGEFWMRRADGQVVRRKAPPFACTGSTLAKRS